MNRRIILSGLSILTGLALLGAGAFAAFTSQATATANTFASGNESLQISSDNNSYSSTIASPFGGTGITPGYNQTFGFYLKNQGPDTLTITANFANGSGSSLEDSLLTQFSCNNGANPSAYSVTAMRAGSVSLGTLTPGQATYCTFNVTLPSSTDNSAANKSSTFDVLFNAATQ